jgi:hypothetical protein
MGFGWYPQGTLCCLQLGSLTQIYSKIQSKKNMKFPKPLNTSRHIKTYWHSNIEACSKSKNEIGLQSANSQIFTKQYRPANCHIHMQLSMIFLGKPCFFLISVLIYWKVFDQIWLGNRSWRNHEWAVNSARLVIIMSRWKLHRWSSWIPHHNRHRHWE